VPKPDALYILEHRAHQMKCINYLQNLVDLNMSTDADWDSVARPSVVEDKVDAYITQQMSKYHIPGCAVSVVKGGEFLKLRGYGISSVEFDIPANKDSVFQIYSVTKIFAGIATMMLVEDGSLFLNTPVTEVMNNFPPDWGAIHIRHLLTHTSGLPEISDNPRYKNLPEGGRKKLTEAEEIRLAAEMPLKFKPGDNFSYHRLGYNLLGTIIEKLAKKPLSSFLEERVFTPLGMTSTHFGDTEVIVKGRPSTAYNRETGELRNWIYLFGARPNLGSGLNSTVVDLTKLLVALDKGNVLKRESLYEMWSPVKLNDGTERDYGLGWTIARHKGHKVVGHEGGGSAWIAHFPDEHLSIAVLCNLNGVRADEIQYDIADLYLVRQ
jgi:D-alanyl-D-alanine carboxypeptidase